MQRMCLAILDFLEQYHKEGNEFFNHIVTGDEEWVYRFVNVETKEESKQCMDSHSPNKLKTAES
jgi:hypothetical protein